jgi:molybdenum cofactor synthesis domain
MLNKIKREELISILYDDFKFNREIENIYIFQAVGRILAEDVFSNIELPNTQTAALDGIAYAYKTLETKEIKNWVLGEDYVYANTGVAVESTYDTLSPVEYIKVKDNVLSIDKENLPKEKGEYINKPGTFIKYDELLVRKNTSLKPAHISLLASGGVRKIKVIKKPVVAVIPTGNELVPYGMPLPIGKNYETNSLMFRGFIEEWGGRANIFPIIPDDKTLLVAALKRAIEESDIIIFNAGSSLGSKDFSKEVLEEVAEMKVEKVAHGPAYPTCFAISGNKAILGIVGPPLGAETTSYFYLRPLMDNYLNRDKHEPTKIDVRIMDDYLEPRPLDFFERVRVVFEDGEYRAYNIKNERSHRISGVRDANAYLRVAVGKTIKKNDIREVEIY